jgi:hypothetical protein
VRWWVVPWELLKSARKVRDHLMKDLEGEWREHIIERYKELADKVEEFEKLYFSDGEYVLLGYAVIYKRGDVIVKAIVAHGENDVIVDVVDIEEWLREYKSDP